MTRKLTALIGLMFIAGCDTGTPTQASGDTAQVQNAAPRELCCRNPGRDR